MSGKTENFPADALACYAWRHWRVRVARKNLPCELSVLPGKRLQKSKSLFQAIADSEMNFLCHKTCWNWLKKDCSSFITKAEFRLEGHTSLNLFIPNQKRTYWYTFLHIGKVKMKL